MYCKNCGKWLNDDDKFCSRCGTKAEAEFVPAFREDADGEAPKKKFHIDSFKWDLEGYPKAKTPKTEEVNFDWNSVMDEKQRRDTEAQRDREKTEKDDDGVSLEEKLFGADYVPVFGGDSTKVVSREEKEAAKSASQEEIFAGVDKEAPDDIADIADKAQRTDSKPAESARIDKFYTFNKKQEEFQQLLDKEYERLKSGGVVLEVEPEAFQPEIPEIIETDSVEAQATTPEEIEPEVTEPEVIEPEVTEPEAIEPEAIEPEVTEPEAIEPEEIEPEVTESETIEPEPTEQAEPEAIQPESRKFKSADFIGVTLAGTPESVIAGEELKREEYSEKAHEEWPPSGSTEGIAEEAGDKAGEADGTNETDSEKEKEKEKGPEHKLTFDDVFNDDDDDDDLPKEPKPKKKNKALKIVAIVLCVLIGAELVLIGIQYFAKGTPLADKINSGYEYVLGLFGGGKNGGSGTDDSADMQHTEITDLINAHISESKNIPTVGEDIKLTFDDTVDYGIENFENAAAFTDGAWHTSDDGKKITYGDGLISSLIGYYSAWSDKMNGENDDVLKFVDDSSEFYNAADNLEGESGVQYAINMLKVGEVRTGQESYYIMVSIEKVNSDNNKKETEKNIVCMRPMDNEMKIIDIIKV